MHWTGNTSFTVFLAEKAAWKVAEALGFVQEDFGYQRTQHFWAKTNEFPLVKHFLILFCLIRQNMSQQVVQHLWVDVELIKPEPDQKWKVNRSMFTIGEPADTHFFYAYLTLFNQIEHEVGAIQLGGIEIVVPDELTNTPYAIGLPSRKIIIPHQRRLLIDWTYRISGKGILVMSLPTFGQLVTPELTAQIKNLDGNARQAYMTAVCYGLQPQQLRTYQPDITQFLKQPDEYQFVPRPPEF